MTKTQIARYIRDHLDEIAQEWAAALHGRLPVYRRFSEAILFRTMRWNVQVVAHLVGSGTYPPRSRYVEKLAELRLRYDFTLGDVIRAILLCRDLLVERLGGPTSRPHVRRAMEHLLTDFAECYHRLQLRKEMQRSEQLVRMQEQVKHSALERQVEQAEKLASLGQLTAGLAHEIGTPLNIISGNAEYVLMHLRNDNPRRAELRAIIRETDRVARMIRRLLDFARPKPLHVETVDVNTLVRETVDVLARQAAQESITIEYRLSDRLAPVSADRGQLEQVFVNLGLNAIHAMAEGGVLTITTRPIRRRHPGEGVEPMVAVAFQDTGQGIRAKDRKRIFEPFFSTKPAGQGTGLGLAVSARIIEEHGGEIRVTSRAGHGATFTVCLPLEGKAWHVQAPSHSGH